MHISNIRNIAKKSIYVVNTSSWTPSVSSLYIWLKRSTPSVRSRGASVPERVSSTFCRKMALHWWYLVWFSVNWGSVIFRKWVRKANENSFLSLCSKRCKHSDRIRFPYSCFKSLYSWTVSVKLIPRVSSRDRPSISCSTLTPRVGPPWQLPSCFSASFLRFPQEMIHNF